MHLTHYWGKSVIYPLATCLYTWLVIVATEKLLFNMTGPCKRNIACWKWALVSLTCRESFITLGSSSQTTDCDMSEHTVPMGESVFLSCLNPFFFFFYSRVQLCLFYEPASHILLVSIGRMNKKIHHLQWSSAVGGYVAQLIIWPFRLVCWLCRCVSADGPGD